MKKILALILALILAIGIFAGCGKPSKEPDKTPEPTPEAKEEVTVKIAGLKGPTSIGLVKLMEDNEAGASENKYEFTVAGAADEVTPKLIKGELDMAAIPSNLASVLYNNTEGKIKVLAINTLGVVYIVDKGVGITSVADLKGKTIYATGKGSTPEYALRYILKENGIDPDKDVTIEWKSEPTEVVAVLSSGNGVAMLPQPYVTVAKSKVEGLNVALDLNAEWEKLDTKSMLITGVVVARADFIEKYPNTVKKFLKEYKASAEYANTEVAAAATLVEKFGLFKAAVAEKAIPQCNITYIAGEEMKTALKEYLNILYNFNPAAVGKQLPADDFYYVEK